MKELLVQKLIRIYPAMWEKILEDDGHIEVKREGPLMLLKYLPDANFSDPIVRECRGLILNAHTLEVVCYPFNKFGNYGEPYADEIDWSSARVQEKIDGSIMKLYWYKGHWIVATNGTFLAPMKAENGAVPFGKLFWNAAKEQKLDLSKLNKDYTYMFELVSPEARIVVPYEKTEIWHIGTRNNKTLEELNVDIGIQKPKEYPLNSLEDCIDAAKALKGIDHEGFVVVDKNWHRIKVKSPDWVAAHHLNNNGIFSISKILDFILEGNIDEYLNYFPEREKQVLNIKTRIENEKENIAIWVTERALEGLSRKDFAIKYHTHPYFPFGIEALYKGNTNYEIPMKYWKNLFKGEEDE